MKNELPRLFIWQRLTGKLLYESGGDVHGGRPWEDRSAETQKLFEDAAKWLNGQLSLCSKCGMQAPLIGDLLVCKDCLDEPEKIDQEELARQAEHALRVQQTFPSEFSSEEAYKEWKEHHD